MAVREIVISSLAGLIDQLTPLEPDPATGKRRDSGIYRGATEARRGLLTSLDRLGGISPPHTKRELEEHILRNFIRYSRPYFDPPPTKEWELLFAAQHHGLPTRLLDWSYSPLVAAHFATADAGDRDRAVWRLEWRPLHRAFGFPELALLIEDLERFCATEGSFSPWELFARDANARPFACMLEPPSLDARIIAQSAVFTLSSDKTQSFDGFLERHGLSDALTRFVIPAPEVSRVRDQLDLVGMDERRLFPDLDGVAARMRRYYS